MPNKKLTAKEVKKIKEAKKASLKGKTLVKK